MDAQSAVRGTPARYDPAQQAGLRQGIRHVALSLAGSDIAYEPGDALGVLPSNDPALVDAVLTASGLSGDAPVTIGGTSMDLRASLTSQLSIGKLNQVTLLKFQAKAESAEIAHLAEPDNAEEREAWLWGREFIDLLIGYPGVVTSAEDMVAMLPRLAPRLSSIASSQRAHLDEVHLTVGVVRYEAWGRTRGGVASTEIADRMAPGAEVPVYLHPNTRFRLPAEGERPVDHDRPGDGHRAVPRLPGGASRDRGHGRNWLFFGDRRAACDYLYRRELRAFSQDGLLTRIDTAFSRRPDRQDLRAAPDARRRRRELALDRRRCARLCLRRQFAHGPRRR